MAVGILMAAGGLRVDLFSAIDKNSMEVKKHNETNFGEHRVNSSKKNIEM